ncbi:SnoaL-like protein [Breoghania corrubedonensis]|uniref:SnoaL-like protein n=1 Tax=Breoghania corrubedonensis TaxID=665038 RepID=A0A2T5VEE1_9HYPH|nr:nuclear transport factor 2 family protein [Breoghania corrubedonensis]PTW62103.1 SnoaL-like protein [Breoghania corrubedonensis]
MSMKTDQDTNAIRELFATYAAAFDDFDADAIADLFAYPVVIWQFDRGNMFEDDEDLMENIDALLKVLDSEGVVQSDHEVNALSVSGPTALASVSWRQKRADGEVALAFTCHYHLVNIEDEWLIASIFNENV